MPKEYNPEDLDKVWKKLADINPNVARVEKQLQDAITTYESLLKTLRHTAKAYLDNGGEI